MILDSRGMGYRYHAKQYGEGRFSELVRGYDAYTPANVSQLDQ